MFVYNVTDMLSDEDTLCARITNLSSIEGEVILVTLIANILNWVFGGFQIYLIRVNAYYYYVFLVGMVICFTLGLVTSFNSYVDCHMNQLTWLLQMTLFGWLSTVINTVWYCMLHRCNANTVQSDWLELWIFLLLNVNLRSQFSHLIFLVYFSRLRYLGTPSQ